MAEVPKQIAKLIAKLDQHLDAYHTAKAALLFHDAVAEPHAAVGRLFGSVPVLPGIFKAGSADVLAREHRRS